jgi:hypothetical protein
MTDDLVRRANYALNDMQGRVEAGKLAVFEECIARIEELEAKLARHVDFTDFQRTYGEPVEKG